MYNVVLFTDVTDNITITPAIGAYKCAHALRKSGYSCLVVGHLSEYTLDELKELLTVAVSDDTVLIGFSRTFFKNTEVIIKPDEPTPPYPAIPHSDMFPQGKVFENEMFNYIHSIGKNVKIIAGGNILSSKNISNKNVDYICLGYGESAIVHIADHLTKGTILLDSTKNIHGKTVIDGAKIPGYEFSQDDMVWEDTDVVNHKTLPVEIGRGCIFRCKFCSYPMNGKANLDYVKSSDNLYKELLDNYTKFGVENYLVIDDTFNDHPVKLQSVYDAVKRLPFQPKFWAYIRLDLLCTRPETIDLLYDIGLRGFYFGIETLNSETGRIIGKGYDRAKQISTIKYIKDKYGDTVSLHGSFIVGLPKESLEQVNKTFDQILNGQIMLDSWNVQGLRISKLHRTTFPSELDLNYTQYGYVDAGTPEDQTAINWENEHMNSTIADVTANEFAQKSRRTVATFKLPVHTAFEIATYGLNLEELMTSYSSTFDFHKIEHIIKPSFIKEYKKTLLELVKSRY
jgi:radical SAM superfamily enzyme YgiQ (UPF0313 family)